MIGEVGRHSGFCVGVRRAVALAESLAGREDVYILGELIHNGEVSARLAAMGLKRADSLSGIPAGSTVIIRSHGAPESVFSEARSRGLKVADATCSFVARVHRIVREHWQAGFDVVIVGEKDRLVRKFRPDLPPGRGDPGPSGAGKGVHCGADHYQPRRF